MTNKLFGDLQMQHHALFFVSILSFFSHFQKMFSPSFFFLTSNFFWGFVLHAFFIYIKCMVDKFFLTFKKVTFQSLMISFKWKNENEKHLANCYKCRKSNRSADVHNFHFPFFKAHPVRWNRSVEMTGHSKLWNVLKGSSDAKDLDFSPTRSQICTDCYCKT